MMNLEIMTKAKKSWLVAGIVLLALVLDQVSKVYIKTHFELGEAREVFSWFWIVFVENNGMAFGIEWFSKLLLTLFRIVAVGILGWYVHTMIHKQQVRVGYLATVAMVIAGALGNIIDCVCYGKIWEYADWFHGKVVDMLYFPLIRNAAGEVLFFRPVFNIADSFITVAVFLIILFYRKDLDDSLNQIFPKKDK
jgi:signal peptidase II